jgi:hypothetical protein
MLRKPKVDYSVTMRYGPARDGVCERADEASGREMDAPEAGLRLQSKPGGPDPEDDGSGRKMALRIGR